MRNRNAVLSALSNLQNKGYVEKQIKNSVRIYNLIPAYKGKPFEEIILKQEEVKEDFDFNIK
jgi:hypothetical protein